MPTDRSVIRVIIPALFAGASRVVISGRMADVSANSTA